MSAVPFQDSCALFVRHTENWDSGYPGGLKRDAIRRLASLAIVDCYDALTSDRSTARPAPDSAIR